MPNCSVSVSYLITSAPTEKTKTTIVMKPLTVGAECELGVEQPGLTARVICLLADIGERDHAMRFWA